MSTSTHTDLSAPHRTMLEHDSGIAPAVIARRGYCTATLLGPLRRCYGYAKPQANQAPGLLIPLYTVLGTPAQDAVDHLSPRQPPARSRWQSH